MLATDLSNTNRTVKGLGYIDANAFVPLPRWAKFYLQIGDSLSPLSRAEGGQTVVIAAPTRAYAAGLVACGYVLGRAQVDVGEGRDPHFQTITSLEAGTPVMLRSGKRKLKGRFVGIKTVAESQDLKGDWIIINTEQGTERLVPIRDAGRIDVLETDELRLPKRQKGIEIEPAGPLLEAMLDKNVIEAMLTKSRMECVVIGPTAGVLEGELTEEGFAVVLHGGDFARGALQDLLRARRYLKRGAAYRAEVLPAGSRHIPKFASVLDPSTVVFDGAIAYLKWAQYWQNCHRTVILDRTERNFAEAAAVVNREYIERRMDRASRYRPPTVPESVEMMAFEVSV